MFKWSKSHHNRQLSIYTHLLLICYSKQCLMPINSIKIYQGVFWTNPRT